MFIVHRALRTPQLLREPGDGGGNRLLVLLGTLVAVGAQGWPGRRSKDGDLHHKEQNRLSPKPPRAQLRLSPSPQLGNLIR